MVPFFLGVLTFFSTYLGGWFSLRFKDRLHLIMAFAAGVLLGVVSFDILPEIINQLRTNNSGSLGVMLALVIGFLVFHILEKTILIHHVHETDYVEHKHPQVGVLSALALAGHSFMDGIGIGLGWQVNHTLGILVAIAVISHDFVDGMNTVTLMLAHKNTAQKARWFLLLDSLAPILGVLITFLFLPAPSFLILYLGFFAGFLLYIGASDILPEAHSQRSSYKLLGLTILGTIFIFLISII